MLHLHIARISSLAERREEFLSLFTPEEHERAGRFRFDEPRHQFIASRGMLRTVLSSYLQISPPKLNIITGTQGKPSLPESDLCFNLSHSQDVLLLGVTQGREIGVDVEHVHPIPEIATMARDHFSPYEQTVLFSLPEDEREGAFFRCWTRKEAYIKARGGGFSIPLRDFDVSFAPGDVPRLLRAEGDDAARWTLHHLEPAPGYVGAVCLKGAIEGVERFDF